MILYVLMEYSTLHRVMLDVLSLPLKTNTMKRCANMNRFDTLALFRDALISIDILLTVTP